MQLHELTRELLKDCFALENSLSADAEKAEEEGFFLPGASLAVYEELYDTCYIKAVSEHSKLAGFVIAVPPGHLILQRLLSNHGSLIWFNSETPVPSHESSCWIAKIAVKKELRRKGCASLLYNDVFSRFKDATILTATAVSPLRNHASENFHRAIGFQGCGLFLSGSRGELTNIVNILWSRTPVGG